MTFNNKEQFLEHTNKHIDNVRLLSKKLTENILSDKEAMESFGVLFSNKSKLKENINNVIKYHDKAKIEDSSDFLNQHNLEKPFYEILYNCVGKELSGSDRKIIDRLNDVDKLVTTIALTKSGLNKNERNLYFFIETVSDIVERGCNPITALELGRNVDKASSFVNKLPESTQEKMFKTILDKNKINLIKDLEVFYEDNILNKQLDFKLRLFKEDNLLNNIDFSFKDKKENLRMKRKRIRP